MPISKEHHHANFVQDCNNLQFNRRIDGKNVRLCSRRNLKAFEDGGSPFNLKKVFFGRNGVEGSPNLSY